MRAVTALPGTFSLARKRIGAWVDLFRFQQIARVGKARSDIVVRDARIIAQDVNLLPPVRHQANHKINRKARPADDRLAGEDIRIEHDAGGVGQSSLLGESRAYNKSNIIALSLTLPRLTQT